MEKIDVRIGMRVRINDTLLSHTGEEGIVTKLHWSYENAFIVLNSADGREMQLDCGYFDEHPDQSGMKEAEVEIGAGYLIFNAGSYSGKTATVVSTHPQAKDHNSWRSVFMVSIEGVEEILPMGVWHFEHKVKEAPSTILSNWLKSI